MSTYTPISSFTATTSISSVTIAGIPQNYTDLVLVIDTAMSSSGATVYIRVNSDSGSNYSTTTLYENGTSASSARLTNNTNGMMVGPYDGFSTERLNAICHFMNYANTTTYKTMINRFGQSDKSNDATVNLWRSTSAITTILVRNNSSQTFASGSTFNLYGIANASITNVAKATGGSSITTDGTYWYHTFHTSGTFTPTQALTCDYAVVGGGGGGGSYFSNTYSFVSGAGGGGGGGVSSSNNSFASGTNYSVTIGAGATASYGTAGSGTTSSLIGGALSISSNGGSGGGNGGPSTVGAGGTAGTGGGAGGSGGAFNNVGNAGSNGTNVTWSATYGSGGGGGAGAGQTGGAGGTGGGGTGMDWESLYFNYAVLPGTANTGGGGGGATQPYTISSANKTGGNGGSGIVIIRYTV